MARLASANEPYDGAWTMSPVEETFTVHEWSASCGPAPKSGTMWTGGPMTIRSVDGELAISGQRTFRTDQCIDTMPTLLRDVHTQDARSWRTRCSMPANDSRRAVVNTAYFVLPGDDSISVAETGRYEFSLKSAHCVADVQRTASLHRIASQAIGSGVQPSLAAPSAARPSSPQPANVPSCASPQDPARLEVRPSRKLLRTGDSFSFQAKVLDANGCITSTPIKWTLGPVTFNGGGADAGTPSIDGTGKLTLPARDFADAVFEVIVTAGGRSARAIVQVTLPADYDALLAQSGLDSNGERAEPAVTLLATNAIGASGAHAEDSAAHRRLVFLGIVASLALALGGVALVGARRARNARETQRAAEQRHADKMVEYERVKRDREAQHAAQMQAHLESVALAQQQASSATAGGIATGPMFCPSCRRELPAGNTHCPYDSNRLVAIAGNETLMSGPSGGICPTCNRGYNPGVKVCAVDGDELVPTVVASVGSGSRSLPSRGKICPTCGGRFDGAARFCGKDGTQLVLVN
jgi:hypothetical protein